MKRGFLIAFSFVSFAMILSISSGFENGNPGFEITKKYSQDDTIKGWINISLENELLSSLFTDSFNNSISLIKLLNLNNNLEYECSPSDCESGYSPGNSENTKTFSLNKGQSKIIGIMFTGDNFKEISGFAMNISSTVAESTEPQIYIDILNDGEIEWKPYTPSNNFYGEKNGCYGSPDETVFIYNEQQCEKINLPSAPKVEIGAYVIEESGGSVDFDISICDKNYINCNYCEATALTSGRTACVSDKKIEERDDFFVCIRTQNIADNTKYKINSETNNPCGFAKDRTNPRDFQIFAKPGKYASIKEFTLNNEELQNSGSYTDLKFYIEEYIKRYNNSCPSGCIVPIKFTANELQTVTISDVSVGYTISGVLKVTNKIYDLTENPATITSDFQKINLNDANFSVVGEFGASINYSLYLNSNEIISEEIVLERIPKIVSLNPKTAIAAYPTEFTVNVDNFDFAGKIVSYNWDFGFGNRTTKTTLENKATNTYDSLGIYNVKVSVTYSNSFTTSKTFEVIVKTPKEAINSVLKNKLDNLNKINSQIESLPAFNRDSISKTLNLSEIEDKLSALQKRKANATLDEDYVNLMKDLIKLSIPKSISQSKIVESTRFYPDENSINLEILESITGGTYSSETESEYKESIQAWYFKNMDARVTSKEFSLIYDDSARGSLSFFEIRIKENQEREDSYFIMPKLDDLEFKVNSQKKETRNYVYIEITSDEKVIEFSTTEDIGFSELPAFISPSINDLSIVKIDLSEKADKLSKQTIFILSIILAFFIGLIAYMVIQEWYKKRYEDYLFRDKNNLYNMVSYIESSKRRGLKNKEISSKLKKSGWNSEQVKYVMKKYAGKRTGMFEIPVDKLLSIFKKKNPPIHPSNRFKKYPHHKI